MFRNSAVAEATSRSDSTCVTSGREEGPSPSYVVVPPANADVFGRSRGALIELAGQMLVSGNGHPTLFLLDEGAEMPASISC